MDTTRFSNIHKQKMRLLETAILAFMSKFQFIYLFIC